MSRKLFPGDIVSVRGQKGKILRTRWDYLFNKTEYIIKFLDPDTIPNEMNFYIEELKFLEASGNCPICRTPYTVTLSPVVGQKWQDCLKCKKSKEQIEDELDNPPF